MESIFTVGFGPPEPSVACKWMQSDTLWPSSYDQCGCRAMANSYPNITMPFTFIRTWYKVQSYTKIETKKPTILLAIVTRFGGFKCMTFKSITMIHDVGFRVMAMLGTMHVLVSQGMVIECNERRAREDTRPVWLKDAHNWPICSTIKL